MKKVKEVRDVERSLRKELGRKPKREEICSQLDASISKVDEILQFGLKEISLDDRIARRRTPRSRTSSWTSAPSIPRRADQVREQLAGPVGAGISSPSRSRSSSPTASG